MQEAPFLTNSSHAAIRWKHWCATLTKVKVENPLLTIKKVDVADTEALAAALKGYDTVISAYNPGWTNPDIYNLTLQNYPRILQAAKEAGVKRLLIVGGAGTLFCAPGLRVVDSGAIPAELRPKIPASITKTLSKALTSVPISVTL